MTTLEIIEEQITHCNKSIIHYKERGDRVMYDYYQGRMEAYKHARSLIESDKHYKDYSF